MLARALLRSFSAVASKLGELDLERDFSSGLVAGLVAGLVSLWPGVVAALGLSTMVRGSGRVVGSGKR